MIGVTAQDLMEEQHKRYKRQKEKEDEREVTEDMKCRFRRKPYYMTVGKEGAGIAHKEKKQESCSDTKGLV